MVLSPSTGVKDQDASSAWHSCGFSNHEATPDVLGSTQRSSLLRRLVAWIIDNSVCFAIGIAAGYHQGTIGRQLHLTSTEIHRNVTYLALGLAVLYWVFLEGLTGRAVGKWFLGLRVVSSAGSALGFCAAIGRGVFKASPTLASGVGRIAGSSDAEQFGLFCVASLFVVSGLFALRSTKQAFHDDVFASSVVVELPLAALIPRWAGAAACGVLLAASQYDALIAGYRLGVRRAAAEDIVPYVVVYIQKCREVYGTLDPVYDSAEKALANLDFGIVKNWQWLLKWRKTAVDRMPAICARLGEAAPVVPEAPALDGE